MALGGSVLLGWWFGITAVTTVVPGLPAMKANAALMFVLTGAAVLASARGAPSWFVRLLASATGAIAALTLLEYGVGPLFGLDELLVGDPATKLPGRPGPHTALAFVLAATSIYAFAGARVPLGVAAALLLAFVTTVLLALVGYVYGVDYLRGVSATAGMAPHTALGLLLLAIAIPALRPEVAPVSWLLSPGEDGVLFRRLLPAAILVPPLLGGVRLVAIGPGEGNVPFGISVFAVSMVAVFTALVAHTAREVARAGSRRRGVEHELRVSEARYRAIGTMVPTGIQELRADAGCVGVNPRWEQLTGRTAKEALGDGWVRAVHPKDRAAVRDGLAALFRDGIELVLDHRIVRPDGAVTWVAARAAAVTDADGRVIGVLKTISDVTAQRALERATAAHSAKLTGLLDRWPGNAILYAEDGTIDMLNRQSAIALGVDRDAAVGRSIYELLPPEAATVSRERDQRILLEDEAMSYESTVSGRTYSASTFCVPALPGQPARLAAVSVDITAWIAAENDRDEARADFHHAFVHAPAGMGVTTLDGRFTRVNAALCELTGLAAEELLATDLMERVHPADATRLARGLQELLSAELDVTALELRLLDVEGQPRWVALRVSAVRDEAGGPLHLLVQLLDVTDRRRYEQQLRELADRDPLTGLANRRCFARELERHAQRALRYGAEGALLVLDLDHFKLVNDTRGHAAGDELLVLVAQTLTSSLRETDTIARLGGDEFAVLLPRETCEEADAVAAKLVRAIRERASAFGEIGAAGVSTSLGIAAFDGSARTAEEVLAAADLAMYDAKAHGGDRCSWEAAGSPGAAPGSRAVSRREPAGAGARRSQRP